MASQKWCACPGYVFAFAIIVCVEKMLLWKDSTCHKSPDISCFASLLLCGKQGVFSFGGIKAQEQGTMAFDEKDHPRNPNTGKFVEKGKSSMLQKYELHAKIARVTSVEWAMYFQMLGKEQHGEFIYHSRSKQRWVRIETENSFKILIDNDEFDSPRVINVLEFRSGDLMSDYINEMKNDGEIE